MKRTLLTIIPLLTLLTSCALHAGPGNDLAGRPPLPARVRAQSPPGMTIGDARLAPSPSGLGQRSPAVAYGDGVYLLVWQEGFSGHGGKSEILGLRINEKGEPIDAEPLHFATGQGMFESPAVAFSGGRFLVAFMWMRPDGERVARWETFSVEEGEIRSAGAGGAIDANPALAPAGDGGWLLVGQGLVRSDRGGTNYGLFAERKSPGERRQPAAELISNVGERPTVVWTGANLVVGYRWNYVVLDKDGKPTTPMTQGWNSKTVGLGTAAAAAWGRTFLFFNTEPWPDPWGWGGNGTIIGISVGPDGKSPEMESARQFKDLQAAAADGRLVNCLDAARWRNHPGWPMGMRGGLKGTHNDQWPNGTPAAAYNGRSLLVVWPRAHLVDNRRLTNRDLYLARVLPDWGTVDREPVCIVGGSTEETSPALAAGPMGQALLAYERVTDSGVRVEYRLLSEAEDRQPPRVEYVVPMSATELIVAFDEPIDASSVKAEAFRVEMPRPAGAASGILEATVGSATLNADARGKQREVVLTIDPAKPLVPGLEYWLYVKGVKDRSPAGNAMAANRYSHFTAKPGVMQRGEFIERWAIVGPFDRDLNAHPFDAATVRPTPGDEVKLPAGEPLKWREVAQQVVDLGRLFSEKGQQMCYANVYVFSDRQRDAVLRIDTNDHSRIWLNGRLAHDGMTAAAGTRGFHDYADEVDLTLSAGWNRVLVQVDNWVGAWLMSAQITDRQGRALRDLTFQVKAPDDAK